VFDNRTQKAVAILSFPFTGVQGTYTVQRGDPGVNFDLLSRDYGMLTASMSLDVPLLYYPSETRPFTPWSNLQHIYQLNHLQLLSLTVNALDFYTTIGPPYGDEVNGSVYLEMQYTPNVVPYVPEASTLILFSLGAVCAAIWKPIRSSPLL
jgi:hypothetical protein